MANITDKFMRVGKRGTKTNLLTPGKSPLDTSIQIGSSIAWPTDTAVVFTMRSIDLATGLEVPGTHTVWKGIVNGSSIDEMVQLQGPDSISYQAGDSTEVFIDVSSSYFDEMYDGLMQEHNADGSHKMTPSFKRLIMDATVPVGTIWDYFGNEASLGTEFPGWLLVKNRNTNYARNDYPRLYDHLLQVQPTWVNTTNQTFSLNNLLGRVRVARDSGDTDFSTLGKSGGNKTHNHKVASPVGYIGTAPAILSSPSFQEHVDEVGGSRSLTRIKSSGVSSLSSPAGSNHERIELTTTNTSNLPPYNTTGIIIKF